MEVLGVKSMELYSIMVKSEDEKLDIISQKGILYV